MSQELVAWQAFFTYVGLVAGGLTGLVFVALSLQITEVRTRPAYVVRARIVVVALTGFLVLCGLALLPGQSSAAFGAEAGVVFLLLLADVLRTMRSFAEPGQRVERPLIVRTSLAVGLLALGLVGSGGLILGTSWAMPIVGLATLLGLPIRVVQAWALLVAALPTGENSPTSDPPRVDSAGEGLLDS